MAGPKRYIKNVNLTKPKIGVDRRVEIFDNINKNQGFLPRGIGYEDMDSEFIKFVENDLEIIIDGQKVPVIMLSIQRWAEFSKTWEKSDEFKDIKIPFITIVRNPAPEPGTNQAGLWNIAGERVWEYRRVPSFDGVRQGVDVYKIPQPTSVDLTYNVRLFANKMRDVNKMNHIIHKLFVKRQFYIYPNEHPMPVILEGNSDESEIGDFENRRYYVQNYELKLQGYTLDEDDFKKIPAINRNLIVSEITDNDTSLESKLKEVKFPKAKDKVGVYNSDNKLLSSVFCGENYIVGDSNISNSGGTYNVNLPATNNLLLPNVELTITNDSGTTLFNNLYPSVEDINVTFTCPESDIYINGSLIGVTSGGDDFNIDVQQNGSPIGSGGTGNTWVIPKATTTIIYERNEWSGNRVSFDGANDDASLWNSGWYDNQQTISNNINPLIQRLDSSQGDDSFFKLIYDNIYGNKFRFTNTNGWYFEDPNKSNYVSGTLKDENGNGITASTYTDALNLFGDYVVDHLTGNMWLRFNEPTTTNGRWGNCINQFNGSYGGFNDWAIPNIPIYTKIHNNTPSSYNGMTYLPFIFDEYRVDSIGRIFLNHRTDYSNGLGYNGRDSVGSIGAGSVSSGGRGNIMIYRKFLNV